MQAVAAELRTGEKEIGFVPTMGFLHEGHLSLVRESRAACDVTVVSVFVNPTQFAPNEDFKEYPRDLDRDLSLLRREKVAVVFCPPAEEMYPAGFSTRVEVRGLQDKLCGLSRPHFFSGVCTVVLKLFNIVRPHRAFFGQKDAQQAIILRRMIRDLHLNVSLEVLPVVRDERGLALSSRNAYLDPAQIPSALSLSQSLREARVRIEAGERKTGPILESMADVIRARPDTRIDYLSIVDPHNLEPLDTVFGEALIAGAVFVGRVRLIDNTWIGLESDTLAGPIRTASVRPKRRRQS